MGAEKIRFRIYLITDREACAPRDMLEVLSAALSNVPPETVAVQLREKTLSAKELFLLAEKTADICRKYNVPLLVNDRADVAMAAGAQGVHLAVNSVPPSAVRAIFPNAVIGISTHNDLEVVHAISGGADFVTFGPIFPTPSKLQYGKPLGVEALTKQVKVNNIPFFALGGIDASNAHEPLKAGAFGIACIRAVLAQDDPSAVMTQLISTVKQHIQ